MSVRHIWLALTVLCLPYHAHAASPPATQHVRIVDSYVELHTGPGRGFPIFEVAKRGETLTLYYRHTDWIKVATVDGKIGWVSRIDMEHTLLESGTSLSLRDRFVDGYINEKLELGVGGGQFENEASLSARINYHLHPQFGAEAELVQIAGQYNSSRLFALHILALPVAPYWKLQPNLSLGLGRFYDAPRTTLIDPSTTQSTDFIGGIGVRLTLTRRLALRADYRDHTVLVDDERTLHFGQWSVGASFMF